MTAELLIRTMRDHDVPDVLDVLGAIDPDDAEAAAADLPDEDAVYRVLDAGGTLIGVGGWEAVEDTDRAAWLGWTAIHPDWANAERFDALISAVLDSARDEGARIIFAQETAVPPIRTATTHGAYIAALERAGFTAEHRQRDFYARGEDAIWYSCRLEDVGAAPAEADAVDETPIRVTGVTEAPECDGTWVLDWAPARPGRGDDAAAIGRRIDEAASNGAHQVVISLPSSMLAARDQVLAAGLEDVGMLTDFHGDGIHEMQHARLL